MILDLVSIGNSKGFRIPKNILLDCKIEDKAEVHVSGNKIIIEPISKQNRKGWDSKFKKNVSTEKVEFIHNKWDESEWTW
jgi:antitoxin MazE